MPLRNCSLAGCCRSEDANKAFSTAVQMYDTLVKAWAHWGDYLENLFTKERSDVLDLLSQQLSSVSFCYSVTVCVCVWSEMQIVCLWSS